jgi:hypothetical protein
LTALSDSAAALKCRICGVNAGFSDVMDGSVKVMVHPLGINGSATTA